MKVGIIGAGNMGGAIARGLAQGHYVREQDIIVTNPSMPKLDALKAEYPAIQVSTNNREASDADVVIVAVKPWKMEEVFGCRCGDCSGEALENGRSIEAFALAPASDIGIGCCGIDIRELGTLRRAGDADVPGHTEYRYLRTGEHDADSGAQRFGRAGADDVEPVQRNGACHADRRKAICGGYIAHLVRHCIRAEICASRHASRSGIGHPPERRDEDGGSNGRRSCTPFAG